jgi:uncharacterized membrane protein YfcA
MGRERLFVVWAALVLAAWTFFFGRLVDLSFAAEHWFYPCIMVLGGFVAGITPEGGGAVAFPMLSVFFEIDRATARDFSLMIQSVGMTSAGIYILTRPGIEPRTFLPVVRLVPVAFAGFVGGMMFLQNLPVYLLQALFLSLITTFTIAYLFAAHRGHRTELVVSGGRGALAAVLLAGGVCTSLFGTGADIFFYTLLVTRFRVEEKTATQASIMLMASLSILGFAYRAMVDTGLDLSQFRTWLMAVPVVLFMAPLGSRWLMRIRLEWMLRALALLNVGQLLYFNLKNPSWLKLSASLVFCAVLMTVFARALDRMAPRRNAAAG